MIVVAYEANRPVPFIVPDAVLCGCILKWRPVTEGVRVLVVVL